jgi:uncharacterized protein YyaL (SSP411 family)
MLRLVPSTDRPAVDGQATSYLCRHFACERPVMTVDDLAALLNTQFERAEDANPLPV